VDESVKGVCCVVCELVLTDLKKGLLAVAWSTRELLSLQQWPLCAVGQICRTFFRSKKASEPQQCAFSLTKKNAQLELQSRPILVM
jgi:hypothetical protein